MVPMCENDWDDIVKQDGTYHEPEAIASTNLTPADCRHHNSILGFSLRHIKDFRSFT